MEMTHPLMFFLRFQNTLKMYHWMTTNYARHIASDKLEASMREKGDKFAEVFIGKYSRPKFSKKDLSDDVLVFNDIQIVAYLNQATTYLTTDIFKYIKQEDTELINIRDDILSDINQAKYLFTLH